MGARDELGIAYVLQRPFIGARDAHRCQLCGHFPRTGDAAIAGLGQALAQGRVVRVEAQAHDVHGDPGEGDRDFRPRQVGHAHRMGGGDGPVLAADFVMVGECPEFHPIGSGAGRQFLGCEGAIGDDGMAVEVGVEVSGGHLGILGWPRKSC